MTVLPRRQVLKGIATLPLAAVLGDPRLARAVASGLETVSLDLASGARVSAALAEPADEPKGAIVLIHEWWGLNNQIKAVGAEFAKEGYFALCVDLYHGQVTASQEEAPKLMAAVQDEEATETLTRWIGWLRERAAGKKVGTVGWCFGGGWSLQASIATPVDATVIYYGRVDRPASELKKLKGPVLGHFATRDGWINKPMVDGFQAAMKEAGKTLTVYWYEADHAFANPTSARYDAPAAKLAWWRTLDFYAANL